MDIANIAPDTYVLKILHPATGKYIGLSVELAPMTDPRFKAVERAITDKSLTKRVRGKFLKAEERDANRHDLIVAVVLGFKWEDDDDGKPGAFGGEQLKFNEANVRKLIAVDWLREQIEEALSEPALFFKN